MCPRGEKSCSSNELAGVSLRAEVSRKMLILLQARQDVRCLLQKQAQPQQIQQQHQQPLWQAEYVRCCLALQKLERSDAVDLASDAVSLSLLVPGADKLTVRQRPALVRSLREQKIAIEAAQTECTPADWLRDGPEFTAGLAALAEDEARKLCTEIEV